MTFDTSDCCSNFVYIYIDILFMIISIMFFVLFCFSYEKFQSEH